MSRWLQIAVPPDAREVPREQVERIAKKLGQASISAEALKQADAHSGRVRFWYSPLQGTLSVELVDEWLH